MYIEPVTRAHKIWNWSRSNNDYLDYKSEKL